MRTIITTIVLALTMLYTGQTQAQDNIKSDSWYIVSQANLWSWTSGVIFTNGDVVKGKKGEKSPQLVVTKNGKDGTYGIKLSRLNNIASENDYFDVNIIFDGDKSTLMNLKGLTTGEESISTGVYFYKDSQTGYDDDSRYFNTVVLNKFKSKQIVYVQLKLANETLVYKFKLSGAAKAVNALRLSNGLKNPFDSINDDEDPFSN